MVKKIFLFACLFSILFTVPAMAASSKAKLLTDTSSSANTVPYINADHAEDSTAATALGVQVNGTEMMRVTATGNVGIGTTSPAAWAKLDVSGTLKATIPSVHGGSTTTTTTTNRNSWIDSSLTVTVPKDGTYFVAFNARLYGIPSDTFWKARLYNNSKASEVVVAWGSGPLVSGTTQVGDITTGNNTIIRLSASDIISLQYYISGTGTSSVNMIGDANGGSNVSMFRLGD